MRTGRFDRRPGRAKVTGQPADPGGGAGGGYGVIAIASSAGGIQALSTLPGARPGDFPLAVLVVQHLDPRHATTLADILSRRSELRGERDLW